MPLARHVDPEQLIENLRLGGGDDKLHHHRVRVKDAGAALTPYSSRYNAGESISKFRIPQQGAPVSLEESKRLNLHFPGGRRAPDDQR